MKDLISALAYRLKETNKIFLCLDDAKTNAAAKMFLRQTMSANEAMIEAAELEIKKLEAV